MWIFIWCLLMYSFINLYTWVVFASGQTRPLRNGELTLGFWIVSSEIAGKRPIRRRSKRVSRNSCKSKSNFAHFCKFSPNLSSSYYRMQVGDAKPGEIQGRSQESDSLGQFILVSINKHYLKHLSGPVKYLPCGSVTSPTQGIEYLIIVLTE